MTFQGLKYDENLHISESHSRIRTLMPRKAKPLHDLALARSGAWRSSCEASLREARESLISARRIQGESRRQFFKRFCRLRQRVQRLERPWLFALRAARNRCNTPSSTNFGYYGGRGIQCDLTVDEVKQMWFRDHAEHMVCASLDRIDPDGHYTFSNCRFIEFSENKRRRKYRHWVTLIKIEPLTTKPWPKIGGTWPGANNG